MKCSEVLRLLPEYVARSLDSTRAVEIERHLEGCERCGRELALERDIAAGFDRWPGLEPSQSFVRRTLGRLERARGGASAGPRVEVGGWPVVILTFLRM